MHVVPIGDNQVLIHSPTWIDHETIRQIQSLGTPHVLFAPNHFHHMGLGRYRKNFPNAIVAATAGAIPRLRRRGHDGLLSIEAVPLPRGVRWLLPDGTRSGEAWLAIDGDGGPTWIVCDAFFNETRPMSGVEGAILRLGKITPGLCVGATFKLLCVRDSKRYREWVLDAIAREMPRRVLFSHGDPINEDAASKLAACVRARLG
jgi:hypothetical protein